MSIELRFDDLMFQFFLVCRDVLIQPLFNYESKLKQPRSECDPKQKELS